MKPIVLGAGFALLGAVDLAWIDLGLVPVILASTENSQQAEIPSPTVMRPPRAVPTALAVATPPAAPEPARSTAPERAESNPLPAPQSVLAAPQPAPAPPQPANSVVQAAGRATQVTLHFDVNSRTPNDESTANLDAIVALLASNSSLKVIIDGHSDRNGTPTYNDQLSRARADAVADGLALRGVDRGRISTVGHGARAPVARGTDIESSARNRRVEVRIEGRKP